MNAVIGIVGLGAYHAGVEVAGDEWCFGYSPTGSGVCSHPPRENHQHTYKETLSLGFTGKSRREIDDILASLKEEYWGSAYHPVTKNCCHFAAAFLGQLGVEGLPFWVQRLAWMAETVLL